MPGQVCREYFKTNLRMTEYLNKITIFFGSQSMILRFQIDFTKAKTQTIEQFIQYSHYYLEFLRFFKPFVHSVNIRQKSHSGLFYEFVFFYLPKYLHYH